MRRGPEAPQSARPREVVAVPDRAASHHAEVPGKGSQKKPLPSSKNPARPAKKSTPRRWRLRFMSLLLLLLLHTWR